MCSEFGTIVSAKAIIDRDRANHCKGYGFVMFEKDEAASAAITALLEKDMQVAFAKVTKAQVEWQYRQEADPTNLYLTNLPKDMDEEALTTALLSCLTDDADVVSCRVLRDGSGASRGVGLARMDSRAVCETVIKRLNGIVLPGSTEQLRVKFANGPSPRKFHSGKNKFHHHSGGGMHGMVPAGYGGPYGGPGGYPGVIPGQFGMPQPGFPPQQWANGGMMNPYVGGPPYPMGMPGMLGAGGMLPPPGVPLPGMEMMGGQPPPAMLKEGEDGIQMQTNPYAQRRWFDPAAAAAAAAAVGGVAGGAVPGQQSGDTPGDSGKTTAQSAQATAINKAALKHTKRNTGTTKSSGKGGSGGSSGGSSGGGGDSPAPTIQTFKPYAGGGPYDQAPPGAMMMPQQFGMNGVPMHPGQVPYGMPPPMMQPGGFSGPPMMYQQPPPLQSIHPVSAAAPKSESSKPKGSA